MKEQEFKIERTDEEINDRLNDELLQSDDGSNYSQGFADAIQWITNKHYEV